MPLCLCTLHSSFCKVEKYKKGWESQQSIHRIACQAMENKLEQLKTENKVLKDQSDPVSLLLCMIHERSFLGN